ncbi:MAG: flavodoxin family protein [Thiomargarita sp.]|nr:flavodoxin family protein [Thiomargarita sp.]
MSDSNKVKLLGISASLRNARWGIGSQNLIQALTNIQNKEALFTFLQKESELHLENFLNAGRKEGKNFLEIYSSLKKLKGDAGLSNSEVALASALWAAKQEGGEIEHLSLAEYFTANGNIRKEKELRQKLQNADGLLISGPVYFGDRGSLAERLIDFIAQIPVLTAKLYGGITVGAKRNGGQETTLIYQMIDMLNLGFLAVGNDSDTTAQYGGTGHAGDVGMMWKDKYGLETAMGTGRRMTHVLSYLNTSAHLNTPPKVLFLILQESNQIAAKGIQHLVTHFDGSMEATVLDIASMQIKPCIACDICPTHIDVDQKYRCIIKSNNDDFERLHPLLLGHDMIVPVVVSMKDRNTITNNYQTFIERTRYLRRGDYIFSDLLVAPLLYEEIGSCSSYAIRMMTSFVRHHTVLSRPIIAYLNNNKILNSNQIDSDFSVTLSHCIRLTAGRLLGIHIENTPKYNPVGYVLSANKNLEDEKLHLREKMIAARTQKLLKEATTRLA